MPAGPVTVGSVYVHTGEAGTERQVEKERFMAALGKRMAELTADGREAVICGDWNIAHTESDIKAWKANVKKAGFLPSERQWLTELIESGWVDVVRSVHPDVAGPYSWWSWRGRAFGNTTPAGASTTTWPPPGWPNAPCRPGWRSPPRTPCAGPITRR